MVTLNGGTGGVPRILTSRLGYEVREDFAQRAQENVRTFLGDEALTRYRVELRDVYDGIDERETELAPDELGIWLDERGGLFASQAGWFITVKPGAYPWGNHHNAWRPAHIHFSIFGHSFLSRLVTQMYFPGDPLFPFDPIFNSVTDEKARMRMVSSFDLENTVPNWALCYRFDIVLRGREQTPMEH